MLWERGSWEMGAPQGGALLSLPRLPQPPRPEPVSAGAAWAAGYLAPGARHAERQLVQQLPGRLLEVPPLNLQRIRGGSASPERAGHFDVVSLPYCHIFGDFGKCSWGRGRERRDQLWGGGLGQP